MKQLLLSANISLPRYISQFVSGSLPQVQDCYIVLAHSTGSYSVVSNTNEWEDNVPESLSSFISKSTTGWYAENELPFYQSQKIGQTSLESELHRDFLFVKNLEANKNSLHIIAKIRPIGMNKENYMMSNEKALMLSTVRGMAEQLVERYTLDKTVLAQVSKSTKLLKNEIQELNTQIANQGKNYEVAITKFVQATVLSLAKKYGVEIKVSPSFLKAIKDNSIPFEELEETLSQHIQVEMNMAIASGDTEILLMETHLKSLFGSTSKSAKESSSIQLGRYTRTFNLLDRYEKAASAVSQSGGKIIGKNIASACVPAISVPAITDSLNKHARKIYELFDRYPEKWPIIRSEFRSVANIMEKEQYRRAQIA